MKKLNPEYRNYLVSAIFKPHWLVVFFAKYSFIIYKNLIRRIIKQKAFINDKEINSLIGSSYFDIKNHKPNFVSLPQLFEFSNSAVKIEKNISLVLADGSSFSETANINWIHNFEDTELGYSLNRWGWIWYPVYSENKFPDIRAFDSLVAEWFDQLYQYADSDIWEPYSCAERISNYFIYRIFIGNIVIPKKILNGLKEMSIRLLGNLEYKKGNIYFNHLLNNARGLYIYGRLVGDKGTEEIAKKIITKYFDKIFYLDGHNREGSSHYQFIFTRWFMEIYLIALITEDEFSSFLKERVNNMIQSCLFFTVLDSKDKKVKIPLIGDISPDFKPELLFHFIFSPFALDIIQDKVSLVEEPLVDPSYFFSNERESYNIASRLKMDNYSRIEQSNDKSWLRINQNNAILFFHIIKGGLNQYPSHEHLDTGSFVFFVEGKEVFSDIGRLNYKDDKGMHGVSGKSHNSIVIDDFEPYVIFGKNKFSDAYKKANCFYEIDDDKSSNEVSVVLNLNGYSRLIGDNIEIKRKFSLQNGQLVINDFVIGNSNRRINTIFNIGPDFLIERRNENQFTLLHEGSISNSAMGIKISPIISNGKIYSEISNNNLYSTQYGYEGKGNKLTIIQSVKLPIKTEFKIGELCVE